MSITGKVHMVLENRPAPIDTRVWPEAKALRDQGFEICIIGPKARTSDAIYGCLEDIHLSSYSLPTIQNIYAAYLLEYGSSMPKTWWLSLTTGGVHG